MREHMYLYSHTLNWVRAEGGSDFPKRQGGSEVGDIFSTGQGGV